MYYMAQVKTCDVGICDNIPGFLEAVDNVLKWGSGKYKEAIAEQLSLLTKRYTEQKALRRGVVLQTSFECLD